LLINNTEKSFKSNGPAALIEQTANARRAQTGEVKKVEPPRSIDSKDLLCQQVKKIQKQTIEEPTETIKMPYGIRMRGSDSSPTKKSNFSQASPKNKLANGKSGSS